MHLLLNLDDCFLALEVVGWSGRGFQLRWVCRLRQLEETLGGELDRCFVSQLRRLDALLEKFLQDLHFVFFLNLRGHQHNQEVLKESGVDRCDVLGEKER